MKMREAPWSAAAKLPPWNPNQEAVAGATVLQGAFGTTIFKAAKDLQLFVFRSAGNRHFHDREGYAFLPNQTADSSLRSE
jgi:hypothetical protein